MLFVIVENSVVSVQPEHSVIRIVFNFDDELSLFNVCEDFVDGVRFVIAQDYLTKDCLAFVANQV